MIPMATLRLKNSCPMASTSTVKNPLTVRFSKFGITYTRNPCIPVRVVPSSPVLWIVMENTAINTTSRSKRGMITLEKDSIPLFTPRKTTTATNSKNKTIRMIGCAVLVIYPVKYPSSAAAIPSPVTKARKYLSTQPPITQ